LDEDLSWDDEDLCCEDEDIFLTIFILK